MQQKIILFALFAPEPDVMKVFHKNCDKTLRPPAMVFEHNFIYIYIPMKKIVTV